MAIEKINHPVSCYNSAEEFLAMLEEEKATLRRLVGQGVEDDWYFQGYAAASRQIKKFLELRMEKDDEG